MNNLVLCTLWMCLVLNFARVAEKQRLAGDALELRPILWVDHVGWALMAQLDVDLQLDLGVFGVLIFVKVL